MLSSKSSGIRVLLWAAFAALLSGFTTFFMVQFALEEQLRHLAKIAIQFIWKRSVIIWFSPLDHLSVHPHLWKWCHAHAVALESGLGIFLGTLAILLFLHWAQVNARQRKILVGLLLGGMAYAGSIQVYLSRSNFYPEDYVGNLGGAASITAAAINAAIANGGGQVWLTKPDVAGASQYTTGNNTLVLGNTSAVPVSLHIGAGVSLELDANGSGKRGLIFYQQTVIRGEVCPQGNSAGNNHTSRIVFSPGSAITELEGIGPADEDGSMQGNVLDCLLVDGGGSANTFSVALYHEQGFSGQDMARVIFRNFGGTIGHLIDNSLPPSITIPNTAISSVNQVAGSPSVVTVTMNTGASQLVPNNPWTTFLSTTPGGTDNLFVTMAACNPNSNGINAQFQVTAVTSTTFTFTNPTSATQAYTACTYTVQSHTGSAGSTQGVTSVITHYQEVSSGLQAVAGTRPLVMICNCTGGNGAVEANFFAADIEAPAAGGDAIELNDNGNTAPNTFRAFFNGVTHVELRSLNGSIGVAIIDGKNITFDQITCAGGGGTTTECVDIATTGGGNITNVSIGPTQANTVSLLVDHVSTCASNPCTIPGSTVSGATMGLYSINNWVTGSLAIYGNQVSPSTPSNFEGIFLSCMQSAISPNCSIFTNKGGTGTQRNLFIGPQNTGVLQFYNGGSKWNINASSNFVANTDNTLSIGAAGANRPSSIFLGTSAVSPLFNGQGDNAYQVQGVNQVSKLINDFTDANASGFQTITGLSLGTVPANTAMVINFDCHIMWSQATNVSDSFGIQDVTIAPTSIDAYGVMSTAGPGTGAPTYGVLTALATTTATAIVTATPTVVTVNYIDIHGVVQQPSNGSTSAINMMVSQSTAADVIVVRKGSWCRDY